MRLVAIDPGNEESAWCEISYGRPKAFGKEMNSAVLERVRAGWYQCGGDVLAIEMVASYGMAVGKEVFDTCLWIGRFIEACERRGGQPILVYRKDVKLFHCETVKANDANIRAALIDRFGPGKVKAIGKKSSPGPLFGLKGDEWSALAVALTAEARLPRVPTMEACATLLHPERAQGGKA